MRRICYAPLAHLHEISRIFTAERLDLAVEYQVDFRAGDLTMPRFREARIPLVGVDIPMAEATFCGVDNHRAGRIAGPALGAIAAARTVSREADRSVVGQGAGPLAAEEMARLGLSLIGSTA